MRLARVFLLLFMFTLVPIANADTVALASTPQYGNQNYAGALGLDFNVNAGYEAEISSLGAFVGLNPATGQVYSTLPSALTVGIFDRNTGQLVAPSVTFTAGTVIGGDMFVAVVTPFTIGPGEYSIVAQGYTGAGQGLANAGNGPVTLSTMNDYGGALTFVGGGRYGDPTAGFSYPLTQDSGPMANRYLAGTFIYTDSAPVPEPASMFLLGSGLFAIGMRKFRKSR